MNIQWDAEKYGSDFSFVQQYGGGVAELVDPVAGGTLLDLGCGNGALTARLRDRGFRTMGLEASPEQLALARRSWPDRSGNTLERPMDFRRQRRPWRISRS